MTSHDHLSDEDVCPVTGEARTDKYRRCHTNPDRAGVMNACYRCDPDGVPSLGRLNEQRRTEVPS